MNTTKKRMYRWLFSLGQILPIVASNLRLMEICAWYAQFCLNYYKIMPCVFDPSLVKYLRIDMSGAFSRSYQIEHKGSKATNQITSCTLVVFQLKNGMFPHRFANSSLHVFPLTPENC